MSFNSSGYTIRNSARRPGYAVPSTAANLSTSPAAFHNSVWWPPTRIDNSVCWPRNLEPASINQYGGPGIWPSYPRVKERLGVRIARDSDEIAEALGRQTGRGMLPSGEVAANLLGAGAAPPTSGRPR